MVAGVASDVHPIFGRRRISYLLLGALLSFAGYGWLATTASTKATYLAAMVIIAVGFMVQDVVADALSVELARTEEEIKQIQTLGRMALLVGTISVGYLSGWLAGALGARLVFAIALLLPVLVMAASWLIPRETARVAAPGDDANPLGAGKSRLVVVVGLGYAALGVALEALSVPFGQEIILVVSAGLSQFDYTRFSSAYVLEHQREAYEEAQATMGRGKDHHARQEGHRRQLRQRPARPQSVAGFRLARTVGG
jgi:MFS family permease